MGKSAIFGASNLDTSNLSSKIIVVVGTSCAGKSSVCRELAELLKNSQGVHFDEYFCRGQKNSLLKAEQLVIEEALKLVSEGKIVICDTIMRGKAGKILHKKAFEKYDVNFVLVHCPFEELPLRVKNRNRFALKTGSLYELRLLEYAQWLFLSYYQPCQPEQGENKSIGILNRKDVYDLVNDVHEDSGLKILLRDKELQQTFLERMDLKNRELVGLEAIVAYDLIVDNSNNRTPKDCAFDIKNFLELEESKEVIL